MPADLPFDPRSGPDYRVWQRGRAVVRGHSIGYATKPGVFAHGHEDPATIMLAEATHDALVESPTLDVAVMPAVTGLVGAVAVARGARQVWLTDRSALHVEATRRTLSGVIGEGSADRHADIRMCHAADAFLRTVRVDLVVIRVVPDRLPMLQLIHDARCMLRAGGRCLVAGGNNEGAKTATKVLERLFGNAVTIAQHSGHRLAAATRLETLPDVPPDLATPWLDLERYHEIPVSLAGSEFTLYTRPGVFSWEHLDEATEVLAGLMTEAIGPDDRVLDLGCGAGALGVVASRRTRAAVCLADVDSEAVRCAGQTLRAAGCANARAVASDVATAVLNERFDVVVANPPFHVGKHTDLDVPHQFIRDAFEVLDADGRLLLVANRTLPYEGMVRATFGNVATVHDGRRFKVLSAVKGARARPA